MSSRSLMAMLAGAVTSFIVGFLLYGLALSSFFETNSGSATGVMRTDILYAPLVVAQFFYAGLLTWLFGRMGVSGFAAGARTGALIGLLMTAFVDVLMYGTTNVSNLTATLVDPLVSAVLGAITGGVIGMLLGRGSAPAAA